MTDEAGIGSLAEAISERVSRLFLDTFGKGPIEVETSVRGDVIVTLLRDIFTVAETTMIEGGKHDNVLTTRMLWQQATERTFKDAIGELTGREVLAVISGVEVRQAMASETFVLAPQTDGGGSR